MPSTPPPTLAQQPLVSVILPTFRRFRPLLDTVRALLGQDYPRLEVIVADQNAEWPAELVGERDALASDPRVRWLRSERPGVVAARHEAVERSSGDVLLFVDDDVALPDADFVTRHVRNYADATIAAVAGRELGVRDEIAPLSALSAQSPAGLPAAGRHPARHPLESVLGFDRNSAERREVCTFCTCNGSIRREAFLSVGGFDEQFGGNSYGDDYDLALRLERAGHRVVYDPTARLVHLKAPIGGLRIADPANPFSERERVLSGALLFLRHARPGYRWHLFYNYVLRRSVLLRQNVVRPWRQPAAWLGTILALFGAARFVRRGPVSRFAGKR